MTRRPGRVAERPARYRRAVEFVRFSIVGCSGVGVNLGVYYVLTRALSLPMSLASPAAIETAILWNFLLNDKWTFRDRLTGRGCLARLGRFHAVCLMDGGINYLLLLVLTTAGGWWDIYANLCGIAVGGAAKFAVGSTWTWREQEVATRPAALRLPPEGIR